MAKLAIVMSIVLDMPFPVLLEKVGAPGALTLNCDDAHLRVRSWPPRLVPCHLVWCLAFKSPMISVGTSARVLISSRSFTMVSGDTFELMYTPMMSRNVSGAASHR